MVSSFFIDINTRFDFLTLSSFYLLYPSAGTIPNKIQRPFSRCTSRLFSPESAARSTVVGHFWIVGCCSRVHPILTCEVQQQFFLLLAHVEKETGQRNETSTIVEDSATVILAF
jgi:hypothetical protein